MTVSRQSFSGRPRAIASGISSATCINASPGIGLPQADVPHRSRAACASFTSTLQRKPMSNYPNTQLFIDGQWTDGQLRETLPVVGPATGLIIGSVAAASAADVDRAAISAANGFAVWRDVPAIERAAIMR